MYFTVGELQQCSELKMMQADLLQHLEVFINATRFFRAFLERRQFPFIRFKVRKKRERGYSHGVFNLDELLF